jgi:hypothetical protein
MNVQRNGELQIMKTSQGPSLSASCHAAGSNLLTALLHCHRRQCDDLLLGPVRTGLSEDSREAQLTEREPAKANRSATNPMRLENHFHVYRWTLAGEVVRWEGSETGRQEGMGSYIQSCRVKPQHVGSSRHDNLPFVRMMSVVVPCKRCRAHAVMLIEVAVSRGLGYPA